MWVYFWPLYSVPLIHMSDFVPIPYCFGYCSFVVLSEVWEGYAFYLVCFGSSDSQLTTNREQAVEQGILGLRFGVVAALIASRRAKLLCVE